MYRTIISALLAQITVLRVFIRVWILSFREAILTSMYFLSIWQHHVALVKDRFSKFELNTLRPKTRVKDVEKNFNYEVSHVELKISYVDFPKYFSDLRYRVHFHATISNRRRKPMKTLMRLMEMMGMMKIVSLMRMVSLFSLIIMVSLFSFMRITLRKIRKKIS